MVRPAAGAAGAAAAERGEGEVTAVEGRGGAAPLGRSMAVDEEP
jgi:hypothetical protein